MHHQCNSIQTSPSRLSHQPDNHINERIKKIKHKYGNPLHIYSNSRQYIQSKLNYNICEERHSPLRRKAQKCDGVLAMSMIAGDMDDLGKENSMLGVNCCINNDKQTRNRKISKRNKDAQRIQQLEQINQKIGKLIHCLKIDQTQNQIEQSIYKSTCSTQNNAYETLSTLEATKISTGNKKRHLTTEPALINHLYHNTSNDYKLILKYPSQRNYQSVRTYKSVDSHKCSSRQGENSSINGRSVGKLSKNKKVAKSYVALKSGGVINLEQNQNEKSENSLVKQLQFMQKKTRLIRNGVNGKQLLEQAVNGGNWTEEQKLIILEQNLEDIDPFYSERQSKRVEQKQRTNQLVYQTIDRFVRCQENWKRKLLRRFKDVKVGELDREEKGYFLKQDLTRFVSTESKRMYSNRDVNIIFKRLNSRKKKIVSVQDFIATFCY